MRKRTQWLLIGGLLLIIILLIVFGKSGGGDGIPVAIEAAKPRMLVETVTASGKIYPENEVKISPEVSGEIIELTVEEGDSVSRGQLLVRINANIYSSVVSQAQAQVAETRSRVENSRELVAQHRAQFQQAQSNYLRHKMLFEDRVISAAEFEQAEASYLSAKASYEASQANVAGGRYSVEAAMANLNQARENLHRTAIYAPTSGIISQLNVKKGERVVGTAQMAGTEMLTIADLSRIEVRVDVSETDIGKVKLGDTARIQTDAYRNRDFRGVVTKIAVSSNLLGATLSADQVTNYTVHILILPTSYADLVIPGRRFVFKPGMSASVDIETRKESDVLAVPIHAVTTRDWPDSLKDLRAAQGLPLTDLRQVVFLYDPQTSKVQIQDVKTGIQDLEYIQIVEGLEEGQQVVAAPYGAISRTLREGSRVQVTDKDKLFEMDSK